MQPRYLAVLLPDLALWLALAGLLGTALFFGRPRAPRTTKVLVHGAALATALVAALDLVYFVTTGDQLDWDQFGYAVRHMAMLRQVLGSEVTLGKTLLLLLIPAASLAPLWLRSVAPERTGLRWVWAAAVPLALLAPLAPRALTHPVGLPPILQPLDHALQWSWVAAALAADPPAPVPTGAGPPWAWQLGAQDPKRRFNVLVVLLESTRASATTLERPDWPTTPRLAALAARGLQAPHAYTVIPHTTKALIATLCGYPPRPDHEFSETQWGALPAACLAELLAQQGYSTLFLTAASGRFENNRQLVEQMGYQTAVTGEELAGPAFAAHRAGKAEVNYFGFEDAVLPSVLLDWTARQRTPWFATLLTLNAHHPYQLPGDTPQPRLAPGSFGDYLAALQTTDAALGQILDGLQKQGHGDDTLVVVLGDHGEAFGEHGQAQHDDVPYDESLRIPLVVAGPGVPAGARAAGLRQNLDVAPTILEVLGITVPSGARPGRSLPQPQGHADLQAAVWPRDRARIWLSDSRKLIDHLRRRGPEVYDLASDPSETNDIAEQIPPTEAAAVLQGLAAWRDQVVAAWDQQAAALRTQVVETTPNATVRAGASLGCGLRWLAVGAEPDDKVALYLRALTPGTTALRLELRVQVGSAEPQLLAPSDVGRPLPPPGWPVGATVVQRFAVPAGLGAGAARTLQLRAVQGDGHACEADAWLVWPTRN
ncbi:MAG: sulfatase [Deltaproteobacteria bacterium]|nr:sulfatase [Deltaproteobacteria bacterium]